ncbi:DUF5361 domain-containing protein [Nocardia sp. 004]|uniref:DUF5361 domain-containing protein n=1 Tax=Nocardia sp. 004 TaxID=3385978 RepID=UPI0039A121B4
MRQLGSELFGWRDLKAIIHGLPADSALQRSLNPENSRWQLDSMLLADMADSLRWLMWSKTEDGVRGRNRPEPIRRPGKKSERERVGTAVDIDQMNDFLNWGR